MEPKNVVIFLPLARESVDRDFFECYNIMKSILMSNADKLPFQLGGVIDYYCHTFPIDANRNECAWRAVDGIKLKDGSTYKPDITIWLDTDQTFPPNALFNLLKHNLPIVAGVYYLKAKTKDVPFYPVIFKQGHDYKKRRLYKPIVEWPKDELFEIDFLGMGCVQIWREVFENIKPPHGEYFKYQVHPKDAPGASAEWKHKFGIKDVSEDSWFWRQVREKTDYKIMVDPAIECGHIGKMIFTGDMYRSYVAEHEKQYVKKYGRVKYDAEWAKVCKIEKTVKPKLKIKQGSAA